MQPGASRRDPSFHLGALLRAEAGDTLILDGGGGDLSRIAQSSPSLAQVGHPRIWCAGSPGNMSQPSVPARAHVLRSVTEPFRCQVPEGSWL
jgi:hypothetical protein